MSMTRKITISALMAGIALLGGCGGGSDNGGPGVTPSGTNSSGTQTSNAPAGNSGGNTPGTPASNTSGGSSGASTGVPSPTASYAYILQAATQTINTAYGPEYAGGSILKCAVGGNGSLSACSSASTTTFNQPVTITFSGSTAYVLNQTVPAPKWGGQYPVLKCAVEADGTLSGCANTLRPGDSLETEDALKILSGPVKAYVLKDRQLLPCPGDFSSKCGTDPSSINFSTDVSAQDMVLANNRIYVVNAGSSTAPVSILSSSLDPATGALSAPAAISDASFVSAVSFDANSSDTPISIAIKGANAYILTRYANRVVQCAYDSAANTMKACTATTPLAGLSGITPRNIVIQGSYAYITDSSATSTENSIVKCDIGSADGKLANCAVASGPSYASAIEALAFH